MSIRTEKVANLIRHELGTILTRNYSDLSPNMITITQVRMSDDLSVAKVYISVWGRIEDVEQTFLRLEEHKKNIRHDLSKSIRNQFKVMPELIFYRDDSMDYSEKIQTIFNKIHKDEKPNTDQK